jgi:hypothetical protein
MKTYELCLPAFHKVGYFLGLALVTVALMLASTVPGALVFLSPSFLMIAWVWWFLLTLHYRVVIHEDGALEWIAVVGSVRLRPEEIIRVGPGFGSIAFFTVSHKAGKLRFLNQLTGFHEVVFHIKGRNPKAVFDGC